MIDCLTILLKFGYDGALLPWIQKKTCGRELEDYYLLSALFAQATVVMYDPSEICLCQIDTILTPAHKNWRERAVVTSTRGASIILDRQHINTLRVNHGMSSIHKAWPHRELPAIYWLFFHFCPVIPTRDGRSDQNKHCESQTNLYAPYKIGQRHN